MSSMSGYITYIEYVAGSNKGQTEQGDLFNNPFKLGDVDANYTAESVVENVAAAGNVTVAWTPTVKGVFAVDDVNYDVKVISAAGAVSYKNFESDGKTVNGLAAGDRIAYK